MKRTLLVAMLGALSLACGGGAGESGPAKPSKPQVRSKAPSDRKGDAKAPDAKAPDAKAPDAKAPEAQIANDVWTWSLPAGITKAPEVPSDNPMSAEKVALGHQLFMDKRLSSDGSRSCYSCHQNHLGNADGRKTALGAENQELTRNSPTIWNVGLHK